MLRVESGAEAPARRMSRGVDLAIWTAVVGGVVVRLVPLVHGPATLGFFVDYDEGAYFSAAVALWHGAVPYRDFVLVHPPGLEYVLSPAAIVARIFTMRTGFALARLEMVGVAAASLVLVARAARRQLSPVGAVAAVAAYAAFPAAVAYERGPLLEPVLNLLIALVLTVWLADRSERAPVRAAVLAGACIGAATATKYTGVLVVVACIASLPTAVTKGHTSRARVVAALVGTTAGVWLLLLAPLIASDPAAWWTDTVRAQLGRSPDGTTATSQRIAEIAQVPSNFHVARALVVTVAAVVVIASFVVFAARGGRMGRFAGFLFGVQVALFLVTNQYWAAYNATLAIPYALLAGWVLQHAWSLARRRARIARLVVFVGALVALGLAARQIRANARLRDPGLPAMGRTVNEHAPPRSRVFAFQPSVLIAADREQRATSGVLVVDPYGQRVVADVTDAHADAVARAVFDSDFVVVDQTYGLGLLTARDADRFVREYRPIARTGGGRELWQRRTRSSAITAGSAFEGGHDAPEERHRRAPLRHTSHGAANGHGPGRGIRGGAGRGQEGR